MYCCCRSSHYCISSAVYLLYILRPHTAVYTCPHTEQQQQQQRQQLLTMLTASKMLAQQVCGAHFTCFTGTKVQILTRMRDAGAGRVAKQFVSVLTLNAGRVGDAAVGAVGADGRGKLLSLWLHRKLHEEVLEQAFAVSRGLREVVPPGVLALFSAAELQALLGGVPSLTDAALAEWKASTEYRYVVN
jgi:hypothetical protein